MEQENLPEGVHVAWGFPETEYLERSKRWYTIAGILAGVCLLYAVFSGNFLFAAIIVMAAFIYVYSSFESPLYVQVIITEEGIHIGRKYYRYQDLLSFWILFQPSEGVKHLFLDFKSKARPTLSIPLQDVSPLEIRAILLNYLPEDLEKEDEPISDTMSRYFKL